MWTRNLLAGCILLGLVAGSRCVFGEGLWAVVNNHRIYYEIHGSGRPLLLLHGGGGNIREAWGRQIGDFSKNHRVIAPEQVGHGHSPDVPGPLTYASMTEDSAALLGQLGVAQADVVGWSDGGIEALMLAVRYPGLIRRVVATGANVDPSGLGENALEAMRRQPPDSFKAAEPGSYYAINSPDGPQHAKVMGAKLNELWLTRPAPDELSFEMLRKIRAPVLIMCGDRDEILLEHTIRIYRSIPGAELWVLPGTGHATFPEHPEWTNPLVLSFLDR
jgi:pimeloyl-ACP methyl ester carboxylesterase